MYPSLSVGIKPGVIHVRILITQLITQWLLKFFSEFDIIITQKKINVIVCVLFIYLMKSRCLCTEHSNVLSSCGLLAMLPYSTRVGC